MNKTALDQYEEIITDALKFCSAKLRKSFKTAFIQLMIPCIDKFWSGCASAVKRGLEILGIGIVDIDSRDCMMPRAEQTLDKAYLSNTYYAQKNFKQVRYEAEQNFKC